MNFNRNVTKHSDTAMQAQRRKTVAPRVDVYENQEELLLLADVPGAAKDTIQVHVDKGQLTIEARRAETALPTNVLASEYHTHDYRRVFSIPQGIDGAKIAAEFASGVLQLRLPKSESTKPRRIDVKAG